MKKRMLACVLALCMVMTMAPTVAFAADDGVMESLDCTEAARNESCAACQSDLDACTGTPAEGAEQPADNTEQLAEDAKETIDVTEQTEDASSPRMRLRMHPQRRARPLCC